MSKIDSNIQGYDITHVIYEDVCSDDYYGKEYRFKHVDFVMCSEDEVKALVNELNIKNNSYYGKDEPEDEFDLNYVDQNYYKYSVVRFIKPDQFREKHLKDS